MEKLPILVTATTLDEHAYAPVRSILEKRGHQVIVYRTDVALSGQERLSLAISEHGELDIEYNEQPITPDKIGAAWYRKVANFAIPDAAEDYAKQLYVNNEVKLMHDTLWTLYPENIWLNAPERMRKTDRKLGQLLIARELGFSIPQTVVASEWQDISTRLLTEPNSQMIVKVVRGIISEKDTLKALYTTVLDEAKVAALQHTTTPFPGIYQPFLDKFREWRVTVIGDRVFPAAIYTEGAAKEDWRLHQLTKAVRFKDENLPENISEKCLQFLGKTGLKFGAFDFIEKQDGEIIFLECNPNGQYGWLEDELGFPISESTADELLKIAAEK